ncbi:hypothetical protein Ddye_000065 [Dipteronia dyeriana]|uniref:Phytocyanin domain-containing protein n=1 Tax=Dipteronia dyeriana TaxID=168575 RepID=A0AAD9XLI6_9ROSI|nr:hypothetical protein Ddye_000065 [Dipteronia dyeriana]
MMSRSGLLLAVAIGAALILVEQCWAAQHVVGGAQGWDESTDFSSWASAQTFKVGDQLVFKYSSGLHSVVELGSESAYKSCDLGTALDSMNTGKDVVKLDKSGTRYFACGTLGHCDQGMKLKITTVSSSGTTSSTTSTPDSPSSSKSPASTSGASGSFASFVLLLLALLGTSLIFYMF